MNIARKGFVTALSVGLAFTAPGCSDTKTPAPDVQTPDLELNYPYLLPVDQSSDSLPEGVELYTTFHYGISEQINKRQNVIVMAGACTVTRVMNNSLFGGGSPVIQINQFPLAVDIPNGTSGNELLGGVQTGQFDADQALEISDEKINGEVNPLPGDSINKAARNGMLINGTTGEVPGWNEPVDREVQATETQLSISSKSVRPSGFLEADFPKTYNLIPSNPELKKYTEQIGKIIIVQTTGKQPADIVHEVEQYCDTTQ